MLNLKTGIDSLTNFKRQSADFIDRLQKSGEPLVLTVNGKAEVVVQDAAAYQQLLETAARLEREQTIAAVKEGLADKAAGRTKPAKQMFRELARKFDLTLVEG